MMNNSNEHISVLLDESIEGLSIKSNGIYVDCTAGRGGHSQKIIEKLDNGKLICIDRDIEAINFIKNKFKNYENVFYFHSVFSDLTKLLEQLNISKVDGILLDLGVSSPQLDNIERGFSYNSDSQLDMRMDQSQEISAFDIVNTYELRELINIFNVYGECKHSNQVAKNIIKNRAIKPIQTTLELSNIIKSSLPTKELYKPKHPARTYFQAIRVVVNKEQEEIESIINQAIDLLNNSGRLVVISFNSLEDSWVKKTLKKYLVSSIPSYLPVNENLSKPICKRIKATKTTNDEIDINKRARSSKMHIIERN